MDQFDAIADFEASIFTDPAVFSDSDDDLDSDDFATKESSSSRRPTVKEHSKAQREKRKLFLQKLENHARKLSDSIKASNDARLERFERVENFKRKCSSKLGEFLRFWFGTSHDFSGFYTHWNEIWEQDHITVSLPVAITHYSPPPAASNGRLVLQGIEQIRSYLSGYDFMTVSVAKFGTNICKQFSLVATLKEETVAIDSNNQCVASFSVVSNNGILCGASYEICFGGELTSQFSAFDYNICIQECYFPPFRKEMPSSRLISIITHWISKHRCVITSEGRVQGSIALSSKSMRSTHTMFTK